MDDGVNKQAVKTWARDQKDEYARLADVYEKTKDRDVKDQMEAIEYSFVNLDSQIKGFTAETKEYVKAVDGKQLASGDSYDSDLYDGIFTGGGQFIIGSGGNIAFDENNYKDITGKWNVKNNKGTGLLLTTNETALTNGANGHTFYRDTTKNTIKTKLWETGPEGIQVLATQDLTGDDQYTLADGSLSGDQSFKAMWESGLLNDKFYIAFSKDQGSKWMFEDANAEKLNDLISEYYTDVNESSHGVGLADYEKRKEEKRLAALNAQKSGSYHDTSYGSVSKVRANNYVNKINDSAKNVRDLRGFDWELREDGKYEHNSNPENDPNLEKNVKTIRSRTDMIDRMEMDAFYPDIYKGTLPAVDFDPDLPAVDFDPDKDGKPTGGADDPITLKEGEKPKPGKHYLVKKSNSNLLVNKMWNGTIYIDKQQYHK